MKGSQFPETTVVREGLISIQLLSNIKISNLYCGILPHDATNSVGFLPGRKVFIPYHG